MTPKQWFDEPKEQSQVKAAIVRKYFGAWARIMISQVKRYPRQSGGNITYADLFAGPGYYDDGSASTPILILQKAIADEDLRERLVTLFNDVNKDFCKSLESAIQRLPGVERLKHEPMITNREVGDELAGFLKETRLVPTLFFIDPYGYKGVSLTLISSALKDWGSECVVFFNMNRIQMSVWNERVRKHMEQLFGNERLSSLLERLEGLSPQERELAILDEMWAALRESGAQYVLPFRFTDDRGTRTSHYVIHVSENELGYEIMKGIMAKESSQADQGVASFAFSPADGKFPRLFELSRPLDELADMLLEQFAGRTMTMADIYRAHHVGRRYIKRNYKNVLYEMETNGQISCEPPRNKRRKDTFADRVEVTFSSRRDD